MVLVLDENFLRTSKPTDCRLADVPSSVRPNSDISSLRNPKLSVKNRFSHDCGASDSPAGRGFAETPANGSGSSPALAHRDWGAEQMMTLIINHPRPEHRKPSRS